MSALVFLHGAGCTPEIFPAQISAFFGSIALTFPGHGIPGSASSIAEFADAVTADLEARGLHDVILCGFSMGAAVALELALRQHPRIKGLALMGAGARMRVAPAILQGLATDFESTSNVVAGYLFADPTPARIKHAVSMLRLTGREQALRDFHACDKFDAMERLGEIRLPVIAITGEKDAMTPPKFAQFLADRIPGAKARIIPEAGHAVFMERPDQVNEALAAFVSDIS